MTKKELIEKISANREGIREFGVKKIGVFGSQVRGEATTQSDVDILVEFSRKSFDNYMNLKFFLEALLKTKVDLVTRSALKPRLRPFILKEIKYVKGL